MTDKTAVIKGTGTVNGGGVFGFTLTVVDGDPDRFHIQISNVYDSGDLALNGGSIVIHK